LPPEIEWKSDELTRRLAEAEEVWFEIEPGSENDPSLQQAMLQLGMAPGSSISKDLTEAEIATLKEAIAPIGMPFQAVDQMRPWLVSTFVSVGALIDKGFDPNAGVEKHLTEMTAGKTYRALETAAGQMQMMASIPEDTQMLMLREALGEMDESIEELEEIVDDWAAGDVTDLADELLSEMKLETPIAYETIFTARNKKPTRHILRSKPFRPLTRRCHPRKFWQNYCPMAKRRKPAVITIRSRMNVCAMSMRNILLFAFRFGPSSETVSQPLGKFKETQIPRALKTGVISLSRFARPKSLFEQGNISLISRGTGPSFGANWTKQKCAMG